MSKKRQIRLSVWLIILLLLGGRQGRPPRSAPVNADDFRLPTLDGKTLALSELRGQWVLINFWATWCSPCRQEMPYLQQLADRHADRLTVLGINMRESATEIRPFVDELSLHFPILLQPHDSILLTYDVRGLPVSVVIAPNGEQILRLVGPLQPQHFDAWLQEAFLAY
jgi:cytochrome c biogenesis protein CcmG, thiol:disulfide interchange protein DsbE